MLELKGSNAGSEDHDIGTDVDGENLCIEERMEGGSPVSELEKLNSGDTSDNESMESGKSGSYDVNPETARDTGDEVKDEDKLDTLGDFNIDKEKDFIEPAEKKLKSSRRLTDSVLIEKTSSDVNTGRLNESFSGSRPGSAASSGKSGTPSKDKDPLRKEREKEREEKIRHAQHKLQEERQRKIEEMREQQRLAQENRERQLEARRRKIEDLKRREEERRKQVEERRRLQEETDRAKKEAILNKAKERLTRYEQWKAHGRKGGRRHVLGFGSRTPREVCFTLDARRSSSQSTLRRSPNSSDYDSYFNRRAVSASSVVRRHCCIDINKLTQGTASAPPTRHKSAVNIAGVKMRDPTKTSPRKPRPSSVATSMPSFVRVETDSPKSSRSKSTDRGPREHSRGRISAVKTEDKDKKAATLPRPYDRKKIEERRQEVKKKTEERKEKEKEKERMVKSEIHAESKGMDKPPPRMSRSFVERMSVPKHTSPEKKETTREPTPVKTKSSVKDKAKTSKDTPKSSVKIASKLTDDSSETRSDTRSDTSKSLSPTPSATPPAKETPAITTEEPTEEVPSKDLEEDVGVTQEEDTGRASPREPVVRIAEPETPKTPPRSKPDVKQATPEPKGDKSAPKTDKEREMEEYKAKLAEKRRLAREKAEREAEIERLRQEELQRQEEERRQQEEERQRQEEEESLRLAAEARRMEEERLQRAIEAEEKRKREEAERLEQERIAKEEAEKKAKEEAERREREMIERAKKEEEERIERKRRLEMIMKRVKTDSTPEKTRTESPTRVMTGSSSRTSLVSSEDEKGEDTDKEDKMDSLAAESEDAPKFKSPLLQKLTEGKGMDGDSGTPKFKSPLLQSIMGKTKLGARLSGTKLDEMDKSTESLTKSSEELSDKEKSQDLEKETDTSESELANGNKWESTEKLIEDDSLKTRSDVDAHDSVSSETVIEVKDKDVEDDTTELKVSDSFTARDKNVSDSVTLVDSTADSALSLSFNGYGVSSHNGDLHIEQKEQIDPRDLVDSSISVRTVDSLESPQTGNESFGVVVTESLDLPSSESTQFEEVIDLSGVATKPYRREEGLVNHSDELLNLNNLHGVDNGHVEDEDSHPIGKPIIAFEENATRRQDVPDLLS